MTTLAIDRFQQKGLSRRLEDQAQDIAGQMRSSSGRRSDPSLLLGYLQQSVAIALERPRLASKDRLAVDLRVVSILSADR